MHALVFELAERPDFHAPLATLHNRASSRLWARACPGCHPDTSQLAAALATLLPVDPGALPGSAHACAFYKQMMSPQRGTATHQVTAAAAAAAHCGGDCDDAFAAVAEAFALPFAADLGKASTYRELLRQRLQRICGIDEKQPADAQTASDKPRAPCACRQAVLRALALPTTTPGWTPPLLHAGTLHAPVLLAHGGAAHGRPRRFAVAAHLPLRAQCAHSRVEPLTAVHVTANMLQVNHLGVFVHLGGCAASTRVPMRVRFAACACSEDGAAALLAAAQQWVTAEAAAPLPDAGAGVALSSGATLIAQGRPLGLSKALPLAELRSAGVHEDATEVVVAAFCAVIAQPAALARQQQAATAPVVAQREAAVVHAVEAVAAPGAAAVPQQQVPHAAAPPQEDQGAAGGDAPA